MTQSKGTSGCMVCKSKKMVGVYEDDEGFRLRACGAYRCVNGRRLVKTREQWLKERRARFG